MDRATHCKDTHGSGFGHLLTQDTSTEATTTLTPLVGRVIASTVAENGPLMAELLGCSPVAFKPSIPHLVYQYNLFLSHQPATATLAAPNPEIPEDD